MIEKYEIIKDNDDYNLKIGEVLVYVIQSSSYFTVFNENISLKEIKLLREAKYIKPLFDKFIYLIDDNSFFILPSLDLEEWNNIFNNNVVFYEDAVYVFDFNTCIVHYSCSLRKTFESFVEQNKCKKININNEEIKNWIKNKKDLKIKKEI